MDKFLNGKTAWITGGLTGMGFATAKTLAEAGANVAVGSLATGNTLGEGNYTSMVDDSVFTKVQKQLTKLGVSCYAAPLDLRNETSVHQFHADTVEQLGPVDILINAAGIGAQSPIAELSDATWNAAIDVNLSGPMRTIRCCFPEMVERRWGRIINIASTAANVGQPGYGAYCASKAGLLGLSRCVALEGAEHGITCVAINPGYVETEMARVGLELNAEQTGEQVDVDKQFDKVAAKSPQKRMINPNEIATLIVFLCRDEAKGITMEDITLAACATW